MKKVYLLVLSVAATLAVVGVAHWSGRPLLPARQSTLTLLYTGDVSGQVGPILD